MTELQKQFFERLNLLNSGERASLRREAGNMLHEADGKAMVTFFRCLPQGVDRKQEEKWFAIACLRCMWDAGEEGIKPLESVFAEEINNLSDSTIHRIEYLLDTKWDSDGYMLTKLTRLIKMILQKTNTDSIDFSSLLDDLIWWNSENQSVQRKWAKAIFSNNKI